MCIFTIYSFSRIFPLLLDVSSNQICRGGRVIFTILTENFRKRTDILRRPNGQRDCGMHVFCPKQAISKDVLISKKAGQSFLQSPIIYGSFFNANFIISKTRRRLSMSNERSSQITKQRGAGNCLQLQSEGRVWEAAMGSHYKCPRWRRFRGKIPRLFTMWAKSENQKLKVVGTGTKTAIATAIHLRQYGNNLLSASQADCTVEFLLCYVFLVG